MLKTRQCKVLFCFLYHSFCSPELSKGHDFKTKQVFTETTRSITTSLQKFPTLNDCVMINSTFPAINIWQILCLVLWLRLCSGNTQLLAYLFLCCKRLNHTIWWKLVLSWNRVHLTVPDCRNYAMALDERKHSRCGASHSTVPKSSNSHNFTR